MIFFSMLVYNEGGVRLTRCTPPVICDGLVALFHLLFRGDFVFRKRWSVDV